MTITDFWTNLRLWLDDSNSSTYKWTNAELVNYFNYTLDEITRDTDIFHDVSTAAIAEIALVAGTPDYAYDSRILEILSARVAGETTYLTKTYHKKKLLDDITWRYLLTAYGTDISFTATAINSTTTDFLAAEIADDDFVQITGSTSNDQTVQIDTVAQYSLTLASAYTGVIEAAGDPVTLRVLNIDTPTEYMLDYRHDYITLIPCPDEAGRLLLECTVKQLTPLTEATLTGETLYTIPLNTMYHLQLIDGVLSNAFLKTGPSTFNQEKAMLHAGRFMLLKSRIKRDLIKLRGISQCTNPHEGSI